jgi:hypothetical protein
MSVTKRLAVALVVLLAAAGCSGGGGSLSGPSISKGSGSGSGSGTSTQSVERVSVKIHVPAASTVAALRARHANRRMFVSPATSFATVTTYTSASDLHNGTNAYATVTSDISTDKNSTCTYDNGTTSGPRTCSITINAPAGMDYFAFQTFSADPSKNTPSTVLLAQATAAQTIVSNGTNTVNAVLDGVVSKYEFVPASYPSFDQALASTQTFSISAYDSSGYLILTSDVASPGTGGDEYANPLSLSDSGFAPGTAKISVTDKYGNDTSPVVNYATDTITVAYTPGSNASTAPALRRSVNGTHARSGVKSAAVSSAPYFDTITAASDTSSGDPTATVESPSGTNQPYDFQNAYLYPIALEETNSTGNPGPTFTQGAGSASTLVFTVAGDTSTIEPLEATSQTNEAVPTFKATLADTNSTGSCGNTTLVSNGDGTFTFTSGSTPTDATCVAKFTDQYGNSAVLDVSNTTTTSTLTVPPNAVFATLNGTTPGAFQIYEVDSPFNGPVITPILGGKYTNTDPLPIYGIAYDEKSVVYFGSGGNVKSLSVSPTAGLTNLVVTPLPADTTGNGSEKAAGPLVQGIAYDAVNNTLVVADQYGGICVYSTPLTASSTPLVCQSLPNTDQPSGVAIDGNSNYYILDVTNPGVYTVHLSNVTHTVSAQRSFNLSGSTGVPVGLAVDRLAATGIYVNQGGYFYRFNASTAFASTNPTPVATQQLAGCQTGGGSSGGIATLTGTNEATLVLASCIADTNPGTGYSGIGLQAYYPTGTSTYQENTNNGSGGVTSIGTDSSYPLWLSI